MHNDISAPAKIIVFGEHAVVYGKPAIAIPISDLRAHAVIKHHNEPLQIIIDGANPIIVESEKNHPLSIAAKLTLDALKKPKRSGTIHLNSDIPIASGMGSGAAVSATIVRSVAAIAHEELSLEAINSIVYEVEKIHHRTPSGIDNTVIVYEQAIYFVRGYGIQPISNAQDFSLLIADTGIASPTHITVSDVAQLVKEKPDEFLPILDEIGAIAADAKKALQQGKITQLGALMSHNHALLQALTVSSNELDLLVEAALKAGALGAKLSGGGRGGNMIALVVDEVVEQVQQALLMAGAKQVFSTVVKRSVQ